jgi:hypothetical protein
MSWQKVAKLENGTQKTGRLHVWHVRIFAAEDNELEQAL